MTAQPATTPGSTSTGRYSTPAPELDPAAPATDPAPLTARDTHFKITRVAHTLILRGELDMSTHHLLASAGEDLTARCTTEAATRPHAATSPSDQHGGPEYAVIDATRLGFIDAGGLGLLVTLRANLAAIGIALRTTSATPRVRRVITLCQLGAALGLQPAAGATPSAAANG